MLRPLCIAVLLASLLVGCGGPTYVNVPGQAGDMAVNDANSDIVREVAAAAVKGLMLTDPAPPAPVVIRLPQGATPLTHADVARRVGAEAISPMEQGVEPGSTVTVQEIRVRGHRAQVDLVGPGPGGLDQLTTMHLGWTAMAGWQADRMRSWRAGAHTVSLPNEQAPVPTP